jgi:LacI family transcriptional regulator
VGRRREAGYTEAMDEAGISVDPEWVREGDFTERTAAVLGAELLALPPERRPSAIYTVSLPTALGVLAAVRAAGVRVPGELSVVTMDDHVLLDHLDPPLTAIRMPMAQMGALATGMLLDAVAGQPIHHAVVPDEPVLVVRRSAGPPATW